MEPRASDAAGAVAIDGNPSIGARKKASSTPGTVSSTRINDLNGMQIN